MPGRFQFQGKCTYVNVDFYYKIKDYTTFSVCTLHVRMYKPLGYVYVTCTNLNIIHTNMK